MTVGVALGAALLTLSACGGGGDPLKSGGSGSGSGGSKSITVGSANFPENQLLAEIYSQALEAKGYTVKRQFNIGAREVYLKALNDGSIDMVPEYNGALLSALASTKKQTVPQSVSTPEEVYKALQKVLPKGTETLPQSSAEDKDTLTVTSPTAKKYQLKSIADLKSVASKLTLGAGPEFRTRFQGLVGLKKVYGVDFGQFKPLDPGGPLTKAALAKGDVQVANVFSTDSQIQTDNWVVLQDPKNLFLAENILPLVRSSLVDSSLKGALDPVSQALTTQNLTKYLAEVQVDKKDPATVAKEFIDSEMK